MRLRVILGFWLYLYPNTDYIHVVDLLDFTAFVTVRKLFTILIDYYPPKREVFGICISNDTIVPGEEEFLLEDGCTEIEELANKAVINRFKYVFLCYTGTI